MTPADSNEYVHLTYEYPGPSKVHSSTNVGTIGQIDMGFRMTTLTKAIRLALGKGVSLVDL